MGTLTSGYNYAEIYQGGIPQNPDPALVFGVYLTVYPDAASWKGPLIITYIGSFLAIPKIGPVGLMQDRVAEHFKRLRKAEKAAVEMQAMDRA